MAPYVSIWLLWLPLAPFGPNWLPIADFGSFWFLFAPVCFFCLLLAYCSLWPLFCFVPCNILWTLNYICYCAYLCNKYHQFLAEQGQNHWSSSVTNNQFFVCLLSPFVPFLYHLSPYWPFLVPGGPLWPALAPSGSVRLFLALFGTFWLILAHIGSYWVL